MGQGEIHGPRMTRNGADQASTRNVAVQDRRAVFDDHRHGQAGSASGLTAVAPLFRLQCTRFHVSAHACQVSACLSCRDTSHNIIMDISNGVAPEPIFTNSGHDIVFADLFVQYKRAARPGASHGFYFGDRLAYFVSRSFSNRVIDRR